MADEKITIDIVLDAELKFKNLDKIRKLLSEGSLNIGAGAGKSLVEAKGGSVTKTTRGEPGAGTSAKIPTEQLSLPLKQAAQKQATAADKLSDAADEISSSVKDLKKQVTEQTTASKKMADVSSKSSTSKKDTGVILPTLPGTKSTEFKKDTQDIQNLSKNLGSLLIKTLDAVRSAVSKTAGDLAIVPQNIRGKTSKGFALGQGGKAFELKIANVKDLAAAVARESGGTIEKLKGEKVSDLVKRLAESKATKSGGNVDAIMKDIKKEFIRILSIPALKRTAAGPVIETSGGTTRVPAKFKELTRGTEILADQYRKQAIAIAKTTKDIEAADKAYEKRIKSFIDEKGVIKEDVVSKEFKRAGEPFRKESLVKTLTAEKFKKADIPVTKGDISKRLVDVSKYEAELNSLPFNALREKASKAGIGIKDIMASLDKLDSLDFYSMIERGFTAPMKKGGSALDAISSTLSGGVKDIEGASRRWDKNIKSMVQTASIIPESQPLKAVGARGITGIITTPPKEGELAPADSKRLILSINELVNKILSRESTLGIQGPKEMSTIFGLSESLSSGLKETGEPQRFPEMPGKNVVVLQEEDLRAFTPFAKLLHNAARTLSQRFQPVEVKGGEQPLLQTRAESEAYATGAFKAPTGKNVLAVYRDAAETFEDSMAFLKGGKLDTVTLNVREIEIPASAELKVGKGETLKKGDVIAQSVDEMIKYDRDANKAIIDSIRSSKREISGKEVPIKVVRIIEEYETKAGTKFATRSQFKGTGIPVSDIEAVKVPKTQEQMIQGLIEIKRKSGDVGEGLTELERIIEGTGNSFIVLKEMMQQSGKSMGEMGKMFGIKNVGALEKIPGLLKKSFGIEGKTSQELIKGVTTSYEKETRKPSYDYAVPDVMMGATSVGKRGTFADVIEMELNNLFGNVKTIVDDTDEASKLVQNVYKKLGTTLGHQEGALVGQKYIQTIEQPHMKRPWSYTEGMAGVKGQKFTAQGLQAAGFGMESAYTKEVLQSQVAGADAAFELVKSYIMMDETLRSKVLPTLRKVSAIDIGTFEGRTTTKEGLKGTVFDIQKFAQAFALKIPTRGGKEKLEYIPGYEARSVRKEKLTGEYGPVGDTPRLLQNLIIEIKKLEGIKKGELTSGTKKEEVSQAIKDVVTTATTKAIKLAKTGKTEEATEVLRGIYKMAPKGTLVPEGRRYGKTKEGARATIGEGISEALKRGKTPEHAATTLQGWFNQSDEAALKDRQNFLKTLKKGDVRIPNIKREIAFMQENLGKSMTQPISELAETIKLQVSKGAKGAVPKALESALEKAHNRVEKALVTYRKSIADQIFSKGGALDVSLLERKVPAVVGKAVTAPISKVSELTSTQKRLEQMRKTVTGEAVKMIDDSLREIDKQLASEIKSQKTGVVTLKQFEVGLSPKKARELADLTAEGNKDLSDKYFEEMQQGKVLQTTRFPITHAGSFRPLKAKIIEEKDYAHAIAAPGRTRYTQKEFEVMAKPLQAQEKGLEKRLEGVYAKAEETAQGSPEEKRLLTEASEIARKLNDLGRVIDSIRPVFVGFEQNLDHDGDTLFLHAAKGVAAQSDLDAAFNRLTNDVGSARNVLMKFLGTVQGPDVGVGGREKLIGTYLKTTQASKTGDLPVHVSKGAQRESDIIKNIAKLDVGMATEGISRVAEVVTSLTGFKNITIKDVDFSSKLNELMRWNINKALKTKHTGGKIEDMPQYKALPQFLATKEMGARLPVKEGEEEGPTKKEFLKERFGKSFEKVKEGFVAQFRRLNPGDLVEEAAAFGIEGKGKKRSAILAELEKVTDFDSFFNQLYNYLKEQYKNAFKKQIKRGKDVTGFFLDPGERGQLKSKEFKPGAEASIRERAVSKEELARAKKSDKELERLATRKMAAFEETGRQIPTTKIQKIVSPAYRLRTTSLGTPEKAAKGLGVGPEKLPAEVLKSLQYTTEGKGAVPTMVADSITKFDRRTTAADVRSFIRSATPEEIKLPASTPGPTKQFGDLYAEDDVELKLKRKVEEWKKLMLSAKMSFTKEKTAAVTRMLAAGVGIGVGKGTVSLGGTYVELQAEQEAKKKARAEQLEYAKGKQGITRGAKEGLIEPDVWTDTKERLERLGIERPTFKGGAGPPEIEMDKSLESLYKNFRTFQGMANEQFIKTGVDIKELDPTIQDALAIVRAGAKGIGSKLFKSVKGLMDAGEIGHKESRGVWAKYWLNISDKILDQVDKLFKELTDLPKGAPEAEGIKAKIALKMKGLGAHISRTLVKGSTPYLETPLGAVYGKAPLKGEFGERLMAQVGVKAPDPSLKFDQREEAIKEGLMATDMAPVDKIRMLWRELVQLTDEYNVDMKKSPQTITKMREFLESYLRTYRGLDELQKRNLIDTLGGVQKLQKEWGKFSGAEFETARLKPTGDLDPEMQKLVHARNIENLRKRLQKGPAGVSAAYTEKIVDPSGATQKHMIHRFKAGNIVLDETGKKYRQVKVAYDDVMKSMAQRGTMRQAFGRVIRWGSAAGLVYGTIRVFRQMIQTVALVEKSIADLRKVMDPATSDFDKLRRAGFKFAKEYGVAIDSVFKSMVVFAQQGLKQTIVLERARVSILAENVTESMSAAQATENLTAATKIFGSEGKEAINILDAWSEVAAHHAVTTQVLADALKRAGSAAKASGVNFDELNAVVTAVASVTRQTGQEVGTALRFMFSRIRRENAPAALARIGISTFLPTGEMKGAIKILDELAVVWQTLSGAQQLTVAQSIAGARQYNSLITLMENYDEKVKAQIDSATSAGAAMRRNAIAMDTMTKKADQLKAAWAELGTELAFKFIGPVKSAIDAGKGFIGVLDKIPASIKILAGSSIGLYAILGRFDHMFYDTGTGMARTFSGAGKFISGFVGKMRTATGSTKETFSVFSRAAVMGATSSKDLGGILERLAYAGLGLGRMFNGLAGRLLKFVGAGSLATKMMTGMAASTAGVAASIVPLAVAVAGSIVLWKLISHEMKAYKKTGDDVKKSMEKQIATQEEHVKVLAKQLGALEAFATQLKKINNMVKAEGGMSDLDRRQKVLAGSFKSSALELEKFRENLDGFIQASVINMPQVVSQFDKFGRVVLRQGALALKDFITLAGDAQKQLLAMSRIKVAQAFGADLFPSDRGWLGLYKPGIMDKLIKETDRYNELLSESAGTEEKYESKLRKSALRVQDIRKEVSGVMGNIMRQLKAIPLGIGVEALANAFFGNKTLLQVFQTQAQQKGLGKEGGSKLLTQLMWGRSGVAGVKRTDELTKASFRELGFAMREESEEVRDKDIVFVARSWADKWGLELNMMKARMTDDGELVFEGFSKDLGRFITKTGEDLTGHVTNVFAGANLRRVMTENLRLVKNILSGAGAGVTFPGEIDLGSKFKSELSLGIRLADLFPVDYEKVYRQIQSYQDIIGQLEPEVAAEGFQRAINITDKLREGVLELQSTIAENTAILQFRSVLEEVKNTADAAARSLEYTNIQEKNRAKFLVESAGGLVPGVAGFQAISGRDPSKITGAELRYYSSPALQQAQEVQGERRRELEFLVERKSDLEKGLVDLRDTLRDFERARSRGKEIGEAFEKADKKRDLRLRSKSSGGERLIVSKLEVAHKLQQEANKKHDYANTLRERMITLVKELSTRLKPKEQLKLEEKIKEKYGTEGVPGFVRARRELSESIAEERKAIGRAHPWPTKALDDLNVEFKVLDTVLKDQYFSFREYVGRWVNVSAAIDQIVEKQFPKAAKEISKVENRFEKFLKLLELGFKVPETKKFDPAKLLESMAKKATEDRIGAYKSEYKEQVKLINESITESTAAIKRLRTGIILDEGMEYLEQQVANFFKETGDALRDVNIQKLTENLSRQLKSYTVGALKGLPEMPAEPRLGPKAFELTGMQRLYATQPKVFATISGLEKDREGLLSALNRFATTISETRINLESAEELGDSSSIEQYSIQLSEQETIYKDIISKVKDVNRELEKFGPAFQKALDMENIRKQLEDFAYDMQKFQHMFELSTESIDKAMGKHPLSKWTERQIGEPLFATRSERELGRIKKEKGFVPSEDRRKIEFDKKEAARQYKQQRELDKLNEQYSKGKQVLEALYDSQKRYGLDLGSVMGDLEYDLEHAGDRVQGFMGEQFRGVPFLNNLSKKLEGLDISMNPLLDPTITTAQNTGKTNQLLGTLILQGAGYLGINKDFVREIIKKRSEVPTVDRKAQGGFIKGPGTETSDSIRTMLTPGDYVLNAGSVKGNKNFLTNYFAQGMQAGGFVGEKIPVDVSTGEAVIPEKDVRGKKSFWEKLNKGILKGKGLFRKKKDDRFSSKVLGVRMGYGGLVPGTEMSSTWELATAALGGSMSKVFPLLGNLFDPGFRKNFQTWDKDTQENYILKQMAYTEAGIVGGKLMGVVAKPLAKRLSPFIKKVMEGPVGKFLKVGPDIRKIIPSFRNTEEALEFGLKHRGDKIVETELKRKYTELGKAAETLLKEGKHQEALNTGVKGQFFREAWEEIIKKEGASMWKPSLSLKRGMKYIPEDMIAQLHKGEEVVPAPIARMARGGEITAGASGGESLAKTIKDAIKEAIEDNEVSIDAKSVENAIEKALTDNKIQIEGVTDGMLMLEDNKVVLEDNTVVLEDNKVELDDKTLTLEDRTVELADNEVVLKDNRVELEDKTVRLEDNQTVQAVLEDKRVRLEDNRVVLEDNTVKLDTAGLDLGAKHADLMEDIAGNKILIDQLKVKVDGIKTTGLDEGVRSEVVTQLNNIKTQLNATSNRIKGHEGTTLSNVHSTSVEFGTIKSELADLGERIFKVMQEVKTAISIANSALSQAQR